MTLNLSLLQKHVAVAVLWTAAAFLVATGAATVAMQATLGGLFLALVASTTTISLRVAAERLRVDAILDYYDAGRERDARSGLRTV